MQLSPATASLLALVRSVGIDVLTAFEVGLFGWMALMQLVRFTDLHLKHDHAAYSFLSRSA